MPYRGKGPFMPHSNTYNAVLTCMDMHPDRFSHPADNPEYFEVRGSATYYSWVAAWSCGHTWGQWSYKKHLLPNIEQMRFIQAARWEIYEQLPKKPQGYQVHHSGKPFRQIVEEFFGGDIHPTVETWPTRLFFDRALAARWQKYHLENASYEVLPAEEHRKRHSALNGICDG